MRSIRHAGVAFLSGILLTAGTARAGDGAAGKGTSSAELQAAFERCMTADVEAEWSAVAERSAAGRKARCETSKVCDLACDCAPGAELLSYRLAKEPAAWEVVAPLFEARLADAKTRSRALDLLAAASAAEPARTLAERVHAKSAKAFTTDHVLAFAQAGSEPLRKVAKERAKRDVRCAALCALGGDDAHAQALARAARAPIDAAQGGGSALIDAYVAASALKRRGDAEHWSRLQERVHDEVLRALDDGAIERARDLALAAEFCAKSLSKSAGSGLAYLDGRLAYHRSLRAHAAAEPDQVFELIEHAATL